MPAFFYLTRISWSPREEVEQGECWGAAVVRVVSGGGARGSTSMSAGRRGEVGGGCLLPDTIQNLFYSVADKTTSFNGFAT